MRHKEVKITPVWDCTEEEWLELRTHGIGGSDAGTVCGVNKYNSPYALWAEKTGVVKRDFEGNDATKWGHRLERIIAEAYAEDYNQAVVSWPVILTSIEPGFEFMFANLDFLVVDPSEQFPAGKVTDWKREEWPEGVQSILEVKTSGIASPGTGHLWANDSVPESYQLQTTHYGFVTGVQSIIFAALLPPRGLEVRCPVWDEEMAQNLAIVEANFWNLVETLTPPDVDGSEATEATQQRLYPRHVVGKSIEGGSELAELWTEFSDAKKAAEEADKKRKTLRARILELVGDAELGLVGGAPILSYKASKDVESFDAKAFQQAHPDLYSQFLKFKPGSRTLREVK
jgi:putative phage-type endonuclease